MATSDSDDFESADEELGAQNAPSRKQLSNQWTSPSSAVDSDSDDDNECMPAVNNTASRNSGNRSVQTSGQERRARSSTSDTPTELLSESKKSTSSTEGTESNVVENAGEKKNASPPETQKCTEERSEEPNNSAKTNNDEAVRKLSSTEDSNNQPETKERESVTEKSSSGAAMGRRERVQRSRKPKECKNLGAKKLGAKMNPETPAIPPLAEYASSPQEIRAKAIAEGKEPPMIEECWEFDEEETAKILHGMKNLGIPDGETVKMPEELTSDKKFKEIFKPDGWEGIDDEAILSELDNERVRPVLDKIATINEGQSNAGWGSWGSWGVSSFINSATAGVSTLTSHVTHGLTLLDEAMGAPNPEAFAKNDSPNDTDSIDDDKSLANQEMPQLSFGFNDILSGVSSITKLVETTGTKVISGGLGTLETIGKKTMKVLQEGDPGLKKKRAFFLNDTDKPILSQMLREAKEKAEVEEKTLEEKQLSRKVHFESLFDDYQGLVHLEALEMLSKQSNMKIQQRLVSLDSDELMSIQETLEEVKELCDLGEDDEEDENQDNLHERLKAACKDLGVAITYEKLDDIWKDTRAYISEISSPESITTEREVFQRAISTLARFTAFSVERFHKTAELLLIKERRSTVNEADALVQLTLILSGQIGIAANSFSNWLNERMKSVEKPDRKVDITTIFLEAANASSYIQDAFRLLIPILQVGAI